MHTLASICHIFQDAVFKQRFAVGERISEVIVRVIALFDTSHGRSQVFLRRHTWWFCEGAWWTAGGTYAHKYSNRNFSINKFRLYISAENRITSRPLHKIYWFPRNERTQMNIFCCVFRWIERDTTKNIKNMLAYIF